MSGSDASSEGSSKKLSYHFGLYRQQLDDRTEEFLRMSKARQIRVGLICAAATTAITVGIVVAILMIYDYAIAIESSVLVQKSDIPKSSAIDGDNKPLEPMADKLDRGISYFDQETFEKIPFLINDLKDVDTVDTDNENENNDVDSYESTTTSEFSRDPRTDIKHKFGLYWSSIRRTSPRPFIFEYKNPSPASFKRPKQLSYRSWLQDYRQTQRIRNIEHIINYLKNTVKVKVGDLVPKSRNAAVAGVYVQSQMEEKDEQGEDVAASVLTEKLAEAVAKKTHGPILVNGHAYHADPLHAYKPEHPSDVNMLVDPTLRSSAILKTNSVNEFKTVPMFRPIKSTDNNMFKKPVLLYHSKTSAINGGKEKPKLLSVMLDIYPTDEKDEATNNFKDTIIPLKVPQFHPRPTLATGMFGIGPRFPFGTQIYRPQTIRPTYQMPINTITNPFIVGKKILVPYTPQVQNPSEPSKMLFHLNLFPKKHIQSTTQSNSNNVYYTTVSPSTHFPVSPIPIPVVYSTPASTYSYSDQTSTTQRYGYNSIESFLDRKRIINDLQAWTTKGPEVIKFNREDAKIPDDYPIVYDRNSDEIFQRRNSHELEVEESRIVKKNENDDSLQTNRLPKKLDEVDVEDNTKMTIRVEDIEPTILSTTMQVESTTEVTSSTFETTTVKDKTSTRSIEPQINGHYRSINRNQQDVYDSPDKIESKKIEINHTLGIPYKTIERSNRHSENNKLKIS